MGVLIALRDKLGQTVFIFLSASAWDRTRNNSPLNSKVFLKQFPLCRGK